MVEWLAVVLEDAGFVIGVGLLFATAREQTNATKRLETFLLAMI